MPQNVNVEHYMGPFIIKCGINKKQLIFKQMLQCFIWDWQHDSEMFRNETLEQHMIPFAEKHKTRPKAREAATHSTRTWWDNNQYNCVRSREIARCDLNGQTFSGADLKQCLWWQSAVSFVLWYKWLYCQGGMGGINFTLQSPGPFKQQMKKWTDRQYMLLLLHSALGNW